MQVAPPVLTPVGPIERPDTPVEQVPVGGPCGDVVGDLRAIMAANHTGAIADEAVNAQLTELLGRLADTTVCDVETANSFRETELTPWLHYAPAN